MKVLITRPLEQATALAARLERLGFQSCILPLQTINAVPADIGPVGEIVIFVSANAVRLGVPQLVSTGIDLGVRTLLAVGPATAAALQEISLPCQNADAGFRSEELLQSFGDLFLSARVASIVCGRGGRQYLETQLREMAIEVNRIEVYQRLPNSGLEPSILELSRKECPDLISIMNVEAGQILAQLLDQLLLTEWKKIPVVVASERIQKALESLGFEQVFCQKDPTESALIDFAAEFSRCE